MLIAYLIIGFILLIKGADWLVDSASKLARSFGVPALVIGLSVVAFGTSAPEATIGIFSGITHTNAITLGDVIGSSIANIALIIGVSALLSPLSVDKSVLNKEIPMSFVIQVVFLILAIIGALLARVDGIILLCGFALFLYYLWHSAKRSTAELIEENELQKKENTDKEEDKHFALKYRLKLVIFLAIGLACLIFGGNMVVESSVGLAHAFGLSEALIGITIVAFGTSLPELVTCVVAAVKKESDIAVGNIIGSNIFNVLFVLGISSVINPIKITSEVYWDFGVMLLSTLLLSGLALFRKKITRFGGAVLLGFYILFVAFKVVTI
ncbi:calcium/sodium antiporter [Acetivibrio cellulolyticus]|uniref:calcium/sodium antiporter n=1 Tax=Acetivibrio cellulolyticus TaxID=35830 RepID=UPI0001E2E32E|nr:calcium/sodium antiporter [Acetivibrio cellulolyticus]